MKNKILLLVLVLFLSLIFVSSGFANLYIINDKEGKNVCITNIDSIISKYRELGYTLILVKYSNLKLKVSEAKETEIIQTGADIQIVDWTSYLDGNYYYIEGILKNISSNSLKYVQVKTIAYDSAKKLVTLKESYANPYDLAPGQEATFKIMVKYNSRIKNFELKVNWQD